MEVTTKSKKIYLKDYTKSAFSITNTELNFDIYSDYVKVESIISFKKDSTINDNRLILNGEELVLKSIELNEKSLVENNDFQLIKDTLIIENVPDIFTLKTIVEIDPYNNTMLMGLYTSDNILCTQNEPEGFRRITYFLDRPDVLSVFKVSITACKKTYPILLSNGNLIEKKDLGDRHLAVFLDPILKPTYLFALVAGDLAEVKGDFITKSGKKVNLSFFVDHGNEDKCDFALKSLQKSMKWEEDVFGLEYDLNDFKVVAVDSFNFGAMENKGLNIFSSKYIIATEKHVTDDEAVKIEAIIAHEYFHNWSGNRITLRDWFQLTLKEGLTVYRDQEFTASQYSAFLKRIQDVNYLREFQFSEDNGPLSHPIQPKFYLEIDNFYTKTVYEKGAEIVRMYETLLGKEKFLTALKSYFKHFDGQAITVNDFFDVMQEHSSQDLSLFKRWYDTKGTPIVKVKTTFSKENTTFSVSLSQHLKDTEAQALLIPLKYSLLNENSDIVDSGLIILDSFAKDFHFKAEKQLFLSINEDFSAPIKLDRGFNLSDWIQQFKIEKNSFNRWDALQQIILKSFSLYNDNVKKEDGFNFELPLTTIDQLFPQDFLETIKELLLLETDYAYLAECLKFVGDGALLESMNICEPKVVKQFKKLLFKQVVKFVENILVEKYQELQENSKTSQSRSLKNQILYLLVNFDQKYYHLALYQYENATNMSDEYAAFSLVVQHDTLNRTKAIETFYSKWNHSNIVINKWFAVQASIDTDNILDIIAKLVKDKTFNLKQPTKVGAVFKAFASNLLQFHHNSGRGYFLVADYVIKLDSINPKGAASLAKLFSSYKKLPKHQKSLMEEALTKINKVAKSTDVKEVVETIL